MAKGFQLDDGTTERVDLRLGNAVLAHARAPLRPSHRSTQLILARVSASYAGSGSELAGGRTGVSSSS